MEKNCPGIRRVLKRASLPGRISLPSHLNHCRKNHGELQKKVCRLNIQCSIGCPIQQRKLTVTESLHVAIILYHIMLSPII